MVDEADITPAEIEGLELLAKGEGPFEDIDVEVDATEDDSFFDTNRDDRTVDALEFHRMSAEIDRLKARPFVGATTERTPILSADGVEFGKPTGAFASGTTITLDPCDVDGTDNGLSNVVCYLAPDRQSVTAAFTTADIISFRRFEQKDSSDVGGVVLGFLPGEGTDDVRFKTFHLLFEDTWSVSAPAKEYISADDWRNKHLAFYGSGFGDDGGVVDGDGDPIGYTWGPVGRHYQAGSMSADKLLMTMYTAGLTAVIELYIEASSGKLFARGVCNTLGSEVNVSLILTIRYVDEASPDQTFS